METIVYFHSENRLKKEICSQTFYSYGHLPYEFTEQNYCKLGGLKNRNLFSHSSKYQEPEIEE